MNLNATILGQGIAFFVFVFFCMKYVWPPLMSAIEKRQKEIADSIASTEEAKKQLAITQANIINHLQETKIQAKEIINQAKKHKIQIINEAKIEAEIEKKKILSLAQTEIEVERKRVGEKLRKQVAILALLGAEKIIEHSVNEVISNEIINRFLSQLCKDGGMDV